MSQMYDLADWLKNAFIVIFDLFRNEDLPFQLSTALVLVALLAGIIFFFQILWASWRIRGLRQWLQGQAKPISLDDLVELETRFAKVAFLTHGWKRFQDYLITRKSPEVVYYTVPLGQFLTLEQVPLHVGWFGRLPPLFIGVGLLLTFVGLAAGLHFATQSLEGQDLATLQSALGSLLQAASVKFITSIAGLGLSLFLTVIHRMSLWFLRRRLASLCLVFENRLAPLTPERIGEDQTRQLEEQANQLKEFNGQLAFTLGKSLEEALGNVLPGIMNQAMQPVVEGVAALNQDLGNNVADVVREGAGGQINNLAQTLGKR